MTDPKEGWVKVQYELIPNGIGDEFQDWCHENKDRLQINFLNSDRRAYSGVFQSYIRGCNCIMYVDGEPVLGHTEDITHMRADGTLDGVAL